jgi:uncharacterized membrane protein
VEIVLCLMLFTATALHVRWRLRDAALAAAQENGDTETKS